MKKSDKMASFIDVFKTNVQEACQGKIIIEMLLIHFPGSEVSFDLEDCDKVLRIKHHGASVYGIIMLLRKHGFHCEELD